MCRVFLFVTALPPVFAPGTAALMSLTVKCRRCWWCSGCAVEKGIKFQIKDKMPVKVKQGEAERQETDCLLEMSFG